MRLISKIDVKENFVKIKVEDDDTESLFKIRVNDYLTNGYRLNQQINDEQYQQLTRLHTICFAYSKCLSKLAYSDHTEKEIYDMLSKIAELEESDAMDIINELKEYGYLNDLLSASVQLYNDQLRLYGKKKTLNTLKKRGVDMDTILETTSTVNSEEEMERGIKKAGILAKSNKEISYKQKVSKIREKLVMDGFDNVDEIISKANLQKDEEKEEAVLKKMTLKAYERYKKKYSGKELKMYCYKYLLSKGFDSEAINSQLQNLEVNYED